MTKKKRGRPAPSPWPKFYPGCGRMVKVKDGQVVPCRCASCEAKK